MPVLAGVSDREKERLATIFEDVAAEAQYRLGLRRDASVLCDRRRCPSVSNDNELEAWMSSYTAETACDDAQKIIYESSVKAEAREDKARKPLLQMKHPMKLERATEEKP